MISAAGGPREVTRLTFGGCSGSVVLPPTNIIENESRSMATFSRQPKLQDEALGELALMFNSPHLIVDDPTPGVELLDPPRLDFTLASLGFVDDFLEKMRKRNLDDDSYVKLVLRCGAYVGEVILRNAKDTTYHWLDYQAALRVNRDLADFGESLGTVAVLWDSDSSLTFPLGKVMKFLENGPEDSVQFFAKAMLSKTSTD